MVRYRHTSRIPFVHRFAPRLITIFWQRLEKDGILTSIADSCDSGATEYPVSDLGIPGLRHFIYKSRSQVQITAPTFEDPYDNLEDRRR
jgi:hypothetical protein